MKIFLRDHRFSKVPTAWQQILEEFDIPFDIAGDDYKPSQAGSYSVGNIVLLHSDGANHRKWSKAVSAGEIGADVVMISTAEHYAKDDFYPLHSCYWLPGQCGSLDPPQGFLMGLRAGEFRSELLQPRDFPVDNLALALARYYELPQEVIAELEEPAKLERRRLRESESGSDLATLRKLIEGYYAPRA